MPARFRFDGRRCEGRRGRSGRSRACGALAAGGASLLLALAGCQAVTWRARLLPPDSPELRASDVNAPFLKVHGKDGSVVVLASWRVDTDARTISGSGRRYDAGRRLTGEGDLTVPFEDVALVETNRPEIVPRSGLALLGIPAVTTAVIAGICAASPKTCFGSCPTFYAGPDGAGPALAEGFSAAIAKPFEQTDVDSLDLPGPRGPTVVLTMRNEALETHFVRSVRLLAVDRPPGARVYRAGDRYLPAHGEASPLACRGAAGDCLAAVTAADALEYRSPAGERDLAEQEIVELTFPPPTGPAGLVVRARSSLLGTFVFYQGLAWLGTRAGEAFARLEEMSPGQVPALGDWARLLGRAEVEVLAASGWVRAGAFDEVGPIAHETQIVPLPASLPPGEVRVRLRLTRGNWKLDRLALAERIGPPVTPVVIPPSEVRRLGVPDPESLARLRGEGDRLVSLPGDAWTLDFPMPSSLHDPELFLESRGYYLEWMREDWMHEEDPDAAVALLARPRDALRRLAPAYKRIEEVSERTFWNSRFGGAR